MDDIAASVLARLKNKSKKKRKELPALSAALLPGGISASTGEIQICRKPCSERRTVHLLSDRF